MVTNIHLSKRSKTIINFFNPFRGNLYSRVNPWHAAMDTFTEQIKWKSDLPAKKSPLPPV